MMSVTSSLSPIGAAASVSLSRNKSERGHAADSRSQSQRRLSREAPRVVKLKDWNGATCSHRPQNAVALAWFANAAMHDRIEEYARRSDAMATAVWAVPCEQLRAGF
jgi:hypothetical protein